MSTVRDKKRPYTSLFQKALTLLFVHVFSDLSTSWDERGALLTRPSSLGF